MVSQTLIYFMNKCGYILCQMWNFNFVCSYLCRTTFMKTSWMALLNLVRSQSWLLLSHVKDPPRNMYSIRWWRRYGTLISQKGHSSEVFVFDIYIYMYYCPFVWDAKCMFALYLGVGYLECNFSGRLHLCLWWCQRHGKGCPQNSSYHLARAGTFIQIKSTSLNQQMAASTHLDKIIIPNVYHHPLQYFLWLETKNRCARSALPMVPILHLQKCDCDVSHLLTTGTKSHWVCLAETREHTFNFYPMLFPTVILCLRNGI